jgi:dual specificity tyrosine-phosphorylation-regulated kinase 1
MDPPTAHRTSSDRPVIALSLRLIETYREINKLYYELKSKKNTEPSRHGAFNDGYDDENYDYIIRSEELFANRYVLKERIGKGSFGQVVSAFDKKENSMVAIKIIKSKKPFFNQAQTEKELLMHISKSRGNNDFNLVELNDHFVYKNHQCLVFEMLSFNLYDLLKNTRFKGVSLNLIRKFSRQILMSLEFLSKPDIDIIHCDLKPENILLRHPRRSALKLIDFGSSCFSNKKMYTYIQSRFKNIYTLIKILILNYINLNQNGYAMQILQISRSVIRITLRSKNRYLVFRLCFSRNAYRRTIIWWTRSS